MPAKIFYPCVKCRKNVITDVVECSICKLWCHRNCAKLSKRALSKLDDDNEYWYCELCEVIFPFHSISNDEFIYLHSNIDGNAILLN